jgi:predicted metallo-beta-lactamase superfamily hydrolase
LKIVSNAMSGSTVEESAKNINKIISNVAKEVIINK